MSEFEPTAEVLMPPSVDRLFTELQRHIVVDRHGLSIEDSLAPQEFAWLSQEVLEECTAFDTEQIMAAARALAANTHLAPTHMATGVEKLNEYFAGLTQFVGIHPASTLDVTARTEIFTDVRRYVISIGDAYEITNPNYSAGKADRAFVKRLIGAVAMHIEHTEIPLILDEAVGDRAQGLLIGVTALWGAKYIGRRHYGRLSRAIHAAAKVAATAKPADILHLPPEATTW